MALTNIVRLHAAYIADRNRGVAKVYIEGLGTAFPDIDEYDESTFGRQGQSSRVGRFF
jgi:hypothetical protein